MSRSHIQSYHASATRRRRGSLRQSCHAHTPTPATPAQRLDTRRTTYGSTRATLKCQSCHALGCGGGSEAGGTGGRGSRRGRGGGRRTAARSRPTGGPGVSWGSCPKMRVVFAHAHFLHGQKLLHMLHITHIMAFERIIVHSRLHSAFSAFGGQLHFICICIFCIRWATAFLLHFCILWATAFQLHMRRETAFSCMDSLTHGLHCVCT